MKKYFLLSIITVYCVCAWHIPPLHAWHDETHCAIAKAAGYRKWYNAAGPDIAKTKAGLIEQRNHYSNNIDGRSITPATVLEQVRRYDDAEDRDGHLYGAIIASLRAYAKSEEDGKYSQYHLAFCGHYLGDLSQPLHNGPYDEFNQVHHAENDGIVEKDVLHHIDNIKKNMYPIALSTENFEEELAREIARIANLSALLGNKIRKEKRNMSREEAYRQLGHSASLLKAVLNCILPAGTRPKTAMSHPVN